ncbi:small ribosomal subunit protein bS6m-like [Crassostrea virginica]|mmetsp:Transcript_374/g.424  ORF Transcript_374/g.424 Transcript_374/m.424 type:complete len:144 (+) Transcript_374:70-501(+)
MPPYEVSILAKALAKTETVQVLKRVCQTIWRGEGIIKKVENLGIRETPYVMSTNDGQKCREARYITMDVDMTVPNSKFVLSEMRKDFDLIRSNAIRLDNEFIRPCSTGKECVFGEDMIDETKRRNWKRNKLKKTYMRTQNREK